MPRRVVPVRPHKRYVRGKDVDVRGHHREVHVRQRFVLGPIRRALAKRRAQKLSRLQGRFKVEMIEVDGLLVGRIVDRETGGRYAEIRPCRKGECKKPVSKKVVEDFLLKRYREAAKGDMITRLDI